MWTTNSDQMARSQGFSTIPEQEALLQSKVAIAGLGGAGFPMGLNLVRDGVQDFVVADPDEIAESNFNRHPGAFVSTLGQNKAQVFKKMAQDINPDVKVTIYEGGIDKDNVENFVEGSDLVFDGIDFNLPWVSVMLHRAARKFGMPAMTGVEIGPSAVVTSFNAHTKTFESTIGFSPEDSIGAIEAKCENGTDLTTSLAYIPFKSSRLNVLQAVQSGVDLPSNVRGVELFGAITAQEAFLHLTSTVSNNTQPAWAAFGRKMMRRSTVGSNRNEPVWAPNYLVYDMDRRKVEVIKQSKARVLGYVTLLAARSYLGLNPEVTYGSGLPVGEIAEASSE